MTRTARFLAVMLLLVPTALRAENRSPKLQKGISQGPLKISADETTSKQKGKIVEAKGNVSVHYQMDTGDTLESFSQYALYDRNRSLGKLWGNPRAIWKRLDPLQPETLLTAEEITLKIKDSELLAEGDVSVIQSSSILKADQITFLNQEKRMIAQGGTPRFTIKQIQHRTQINSKKIVAWTEKKQIQFSQKVHGTVELLSQP